MSSSSEERRKRGLALATIYGLLSLSVLIALFPLLWAIASSFSPNDEVFRHAYPFSWRSLVPLNFTLEAYAGLFEQGFGRALVNTFILSIVTVFAGGAICAAAGFAFARFDFRYKKLLFAIVLITFMVPVDLTAIPRYLLVANLGWVNTWAALIVPGLANSLVIFLFRQFFEEIPEEIIEAARLDGASWFAVFTRIVLPLSKPMLVAAALILFLSQWEAFFWPLLVAPAPHLQLVQTAITSIAVSEYKTAWNQLFAGSMLTALVPILLTLPLQRYYVQAVTGAVKG